MLRQGSTHPLFIEDRKASPLRPFYYIKRRPLYYVEGGDRGDEHSPPPHRWVNPSPGRLTYPSVRPSVRPSEGGGRPSSEPTGGGAPSAEKWHRKAFGVHRNQRVTSTERHIIVLLRPWVHLPCPSGGTHCTCSRHPAAEGVPPHPDRVWGTVKTLPLPRKGGGVSLARQGATGNGDGLSPRAL